MLSRVAHNLSSFKVELAVAGAQVVGIETFVRIRGIGHVRLAVKGGEKIFVRFGCRDGLGSFAAIFTCGKAHAYHDGAGFAAGRKT